MTDPKRPGLLARLVGARSAAQIVEQARRNREADERRIVAVAVDAAVSRLVPTDDDLCAVIDIFAHREDVSCWEQADELFVWIRSRLPEWISEK